MQVIKQVKQTEPNRKVGQQKTDAENVEQTGQQEYKERYFKKTNEKTVLLASMQKQTGKQEGELEETDKKVSIKGNTGNHTKRETGSQTNNQTGRQIDRKTGRQVGVQTDSKAGRGRPTLEEIRMTDKRTGDQESEQRGRGTHMQAGKHAHKEPFI